MFRTTRGLKRPPHMAPTTIPEYPIPKDLETVLDVNDESKLSRTSEMYSNVLERIYNEKYVDLSEKHYLQLLKMGLYLEEYQSNEEMKKRKLFKQTITKIKSKNKRDPNEILFSVKVKDLEEERAWIREGDFVEVTDINNYDETYTLRVTQVTQSEVEASDDHAKLSKVFKPTNLYNIGFRFQNYPIRCAHYALWLIDKENVITYLFPHKSKPFISMETKIYGELTMLNPNIETNPEQKQAVVNILNKSSFPAPYILYGPPGTGKTATLIEAITQIHKACSSNRILVCTPSNTAADEVAKRLLKYMDACSMYRIYSQSKDRSSIDEELRNCSYYGGENKHPLKREHIHGKAVLISTLCTAMRFVLMELNTSYFSHIIIDEAGQGTEADILIPVSVASKDGKLYSQIVLAGDPQQLGPTVISKLADKILGRSILERLMSYDTYKKDYLDQYNPKYITKLLHNYRSHPSIIHISNKLFYDNELVAKYSNNDQKVKFPIIFHGIDGVEEKCSYSPSTFNYKEINLVLRYVYNLIDNKTEFGEVTAKDIGIVTPFKLQSKKIRKLLEKKDQEEKKELRLQMEKQMKLLTKDKENKNKSDDKKSVKVNEDCEDKSKIVKDKGENLVDEKDEFHSANEGEENEKENDEVKLRNNNNKDGKALTDDNQIECRNDDINLLNQNVNDIKGKTDKDENGIESKDLTDNNVKTAENEDVRPNGEKDVIESENPKDNQNAGRKGKKNRKKHNQKDQVKSNAVKEENQIKLIKCRNFKDINVGTVDLFQGQERKIMIMTAVRSKTININGKETIGFLSTPKRFNVAMSRAQDALIVIGNPGILQKDYMWHYLLKYCSDNGSYRGIKFELQTSCNDKSVSTRCHQVISTDRLFQQEPFKLFPLHGLDSTVGDVSRTVDAFVGRENDEDEERAQERLCNTLTSLGLNEGMYF